VGIFDFAAGYALGGKAGNQGIDEFLSAGREVIRSREFQALVSAARNHAAATFRQLGDLVEGAEEAPPAMDNVLDLVKALVERRDRLFDALLGEMPAESGPGPHPRPF
jgi:hypothetical protein